MATIASPEELDLYLNLGGQIDAARADLLLDQAEALCTAVVSPLPPAAKAIVLTAAGRAYANPTGAQYQTAGPFSVQTPSPGLYLTRDERRSLKLLAGRGGAFTVDPTPTVGVDPAASWPILPEGQHAFDPSAAGWLTWP